MTLRQPVPAVTGLAPAGPLRDQQAERKRALANAANQMLAAVPTKDKPVFTSAGKGVATAAYTELAAAPVLSLVPKLASDATPSAATRQRRLAISSRWWKARKAAGADVSTERREHCARGARGA